VAAPGYAAPGEIRSHPPGTAVYRGVSTKFDIKLLVVPARLSMSQRGTFQAGLEAVNRGATPIDPRFADATLTIDGRRSAAWDHALERGPSNAPWHKLPPEQRLSIWWTLGDRLFDGPGRYELVLKLGELESRASVEVTP
jgi:hypothetical protein